MGLFGRKKAALPERDSHIEANLANSKIYVLTARPGTVKKEIPVYLPYDRDLSMKDTEQFIRIRKEVNGLIDHTTI